MAVVRLMFWRLHASWPRAAYDSVIQSASVAGPAKSKGSLDPGTSLPERIT